MCAPHWQVYLSRRLDRRIDSRMPIYQMTQTDPIKAERAKYKIGNLSGDLKTLNISNSMFIHGSPKTLITWDIKALLSLLRRRSLQLPGKCSVVSRTSLAQP